VYSHGSTIAEAKESLTYKITDRDSSQYKKWSTRTIVTKEQAIASYRVITGACEAGVRGFCEKIKLKDKYSVNEIIDITKGAYGNDTYRNFFNAMVKS
jgi:hypothetical protein